MASATVPLLEDDTLEFGEEDDVAKRSGRFTHPYVTFCHVAFRAAALITYLFCGWFSSGFISSFVSVVLLLSIDFWTVKNITGRLMVGLRWWNYVDDNGESHWVFESRKGDSQGRVDPSEVRIFWMALVVCPVVWGIFFIIALFGFKFRWLLLVCIGLALNGANLYGYIKCKVGHNQNVSSTLSGMTNDFFKQQLMQNVVNMMSKPQAPPPNAQSATNVI